MADPPDEPDATPSVAIVVTVLNDRDNLANLLEDIHALDWPSDRLEVVLVDAFSTDGTWELIEEVAEDSPLEIRTLRKRGSIGAGRNAGFERAGASFVAVTDSDMRLPADWLEELVEGMEPGIGVVGGPNRRATDDLASRCAAVLPVQGPSLDEIPLVGRTRFAEAFTTDEDVFAVTTNNALFRREAFEAAGGFDETLVATEDAELNRRILDEGYELRYRTTPLVGHVHRPSLRGFFRQQRNYAVGQAQANADHPEMFRIKQVMPAAAALAFLAALVLGLLDPVTWWAAGLMAVGALGFALYYAVRAALRTGDPGMVVGLPAFVLAWQLAWAVGYPLGVLRRGRTEGGHHRA